MVGGGEFREDGKRLRDETRDGRNERDWEN